MGRRVENLRLTYPNHGARILLAVKAQHIQFGCPQLRRGKVKERQKEVNHTHLQLAQPVAACTERRNDEKRPDARLVVQALEEDGRLWREG